MADRPAFQERQYAFAACIRDPDNTAVPDGVDPRRMAVYRDLFFNNLRNLLGTTFPVLRRLQGDVAWGRLIRAFLRQHCATTPYFPQLPREFLRFLESGLAAGSGDLPFQAELAHYEYAELEVALCAEADPHDAVDPGGDLVEGVPAATAACRVHAYRWPVHRISADYIPDAPPAEPVHLAVFRGADEKVQFAELNVVTAALLARVRDNPGQLTGRRLLEDLAREIEFADTRSFVAHGAHMLREMRKRGLLVGSRRL